MPKRIALVAHDNKKDAMVDWAKRHRETLAKHDLWATGTTGGRIRDEAGLEITLLQSGPLGGDQQLGAMIAEDTLDILVFFTDPLSAHPHDVDVKALTRIATLKQTVMACNEATADYILASRALDQDS